MKFKLKTVGEYYSPNETKVLKQLGFKFEDYDSHYDPHQEKHKISDSMIEINSMDYLIKLQKTLRYPVIIDNDTITIYDDYFK